MKKYITMLIGLLVIFNCSSQTRKVYEGDYFANKMEGNVKYEYFENENMERIYDGKFSFTSFDQTYGILISIVGSYQNNLTKGQWSYNIVKETPSGGVTKLNESLTGEFKNGKLDGHWELNRKTILEYPFDDEDQKSKLLIDEISCMFSNNRFLGNFKYSTYPLQIQGTFDENGFLDGLWTVKWEFPFKEPYEEVRSYCNGICYKILYRNLANGEIINNYYNKSLYDELIRNNNNSDTIIIEGISYLIQETPFKASMIKVFEENYNSNLKGIQFIYEAIGFWVCKNRSDCVINIWSDPKDFFKGNPLHLIEHGINQTLFPIEKELIKLKTLNND